MFGLHKRPTSIAVMTMMCALSAPSAEAADTVEIHTGRARIMGPILRAEVDKTVQANFDALRTCFAPIQGDYPQGGGVSLKFMIAEDGSVASPKIARSSIADSKFRGCIVSQFQAMRFVALSAGQKGSGQMRMVSYSIKFVTSDGKASNQGKVKEPIAEPAPPPRSSAKPAESHSSPKKRRVPKTRRAQGKSPYIQQVQSLPFDVKKQSETCKRMDGTLVGGKYKNFTVRQYHSRMSPEGDSEGEGAVVSWNLIDVTACVLLYPTDGFVNLMHGPFVVWNQNGRAVFKTSYKKGALDGPLILWDSSGTHLKWITEFRNGFRAGPQLFFDQNTGQAMTLVTYSNKEEVERCSGRCERKYRNAAYTSPNRKVFSQGFHDVFSETLKTHVIPDLVASHQEELAEIETEKEQMEQRQREIAAENQARLARAKKIGEAEALKNAYQFVTAGCDNVSLIVVSLDDKGWFQIAGSAICNERNKALGKLLVVRKGISFEVGLDQNQTWVHNGVNYYDP